MNPQMMQAVLGAGSDPAAEQAKRKQMLIDSMRRQSMQQPGQQMVGRVALPTWGQGIANAMGGYMASKAQPGVDAEMQQAQNRQVQTRQQFLDAMMMAMRRDYPQMQQPMLPPNGMEDR